MSLTIPKWVSVLPLHEHSASTIEDETTLGENFFGLRVSHDLSKQSPECSGIEILNLKFPSEEKRQGFIGDLYRSIHQDGVFTFSVIHPYSVEFLGHEPNFYCLGDAKELLVKTHIGSRAWDGYRKGELRLPLYPSSFLARYWTGYGSHLIYVGQTDSPGARTVMNWKLAHLEGSSNLEPHNASCTLVSIDGEEKKIMISDLPWVDPREHFKQAF